MHMHCKSSVSLRTSSAAEPEEGTATTGCCRCMNEVSSSLAAVLSPALTLKPRALVPGVSFDGPQSAMGVSFDGPLSATRVGCTGPPSDELPQSSAPSAELPGSSPELQARNEVRARRRREGGRDMLLVCGAAGACA